jgi:hypothetical protein
MSFGDLRTVKAAKVEKWCIWCKDKCEVGQPRVGFFGKWDGEMQDWHMHPECYDAYEREDDANGGDRQIHDQKHQRGKTCDEAREKELQKS